MKFFYVLFTHRDMKSILVDYAKSSMVFGFAFATLQNNVSMLIKICDEVIAA
jgi:hypothetical protein